MALKKHEAIARFNKIVEAYEDGMTNLQIAKMLRISRRTVDIRLAQAGVVYDNHNRSDLWSLPDDKRRAAIAERASRAAREQLQAMP